MTSKRHTLESALRRGYAKVYVIGDPYPRLLSWRHGMPLELNSYGVSTTVLKNGIPTPLDIPWALIDRIVAEDGSTSDWLT